MTKPSHRRLFPSLLFTFYATQELIIKGLANSRTFQRFALKVEENTKHLHGTLEELSQQAEKAAAAAPPQPPLRGVPGFFVAFFKEIGKDLGMVKT